MKQKQLRLVVTGGGTGGHVYPALETGLRARESGAEVAFFGSLRGQEGAACQKADLTFKGFGVVPLYKMASLSGVKAAWSMLQAVVKVIPALKSFAPDVVFATGGYSSAPVLYGAKRLNIATVLHEQNSVPGRTLKIASDRAYAVCTVFYATEECFRCSKVVRTGMPVRAVFRQQVVDPQPQITVVGGSQGSASLNDAVVKAVPSLTARGLKVLHVTGPSHLEKVKQQATEGGLGAGYECRGFLSGEEMASELARSQVAVCRSGAGTVSELAVLGVPAVFVPYPFAMGDHQTANAREIRDLGAAALIPQAEMTGESLVEAVTYWQDAQRRSEAAAALKAWDVPEAADLILAMIREAAER